MENSKHMKYVNCRVSNVYRRIMANVKGLNEFLVEIIIENENSCFDKTTMLKIDKVNFYEELQELVSGKRDRVCAVYGMGDIDIYKCKEKNKYCIEWSPSPSSYQYYYFEEENFINCFVNAFMGI